MAKMICLYDLHIDDLIHIYVVTISRVVMTALCTLLMFSVSSCVFSKTPNLASTLFTYKPTRQHKID